MHCFCSSMSCYMFLINKIIQILTRSTAQVHFIFAPICPLLFGSNAMLTGCVHVELDHITLLHN